MTPDGVAELHERAGGIDSPSQFGMGRAREKTGGEVQKVTCVLLPSANGGLTNGQGRLYV